MVHRRLFITLAVLAVVLLCSLAFLVGTMTSENHLDGHLVYLPDGEAVMCVVSDSGGVDCNWWDTL
jgi:hypothetical protein